MKVGIGTQFRWTYQDGNPLWKVTKKLGAGVWECVSQQEMIDIGGGRKIPGDYAGIRKSFLETEIRQAKSLEQFWKKSGNDSDQWFASLTPGTFVHSKNSFDAFTRCLVVQTVDGIKLKPIALVGNWRKWDLPSRYVDGTINFGYHCQSIQKGELYRPHASHLWEYQHDNRDIDPRNLPAINLSVPSMTFEQERTAFMWSKVKAIKAACEQGEQETPEEILQRLGKLMKHNLIVPAQAEFGKMKDKGKFFDPEAEPTEFLRCEPSLDII